MTLVLLPPCGGGHDDQHESRELYQRLDAQLVRIAVHGGQKQQNAPRKERIPQLTGMDISANKRSPLRVHPFLIRYFSVELPSEREAEGRMEDLAYKRFGTRGANFRPPASSRWRPLPDPRSLQKPPLEAPGSLGMIGPSPGSSSSCRRRSPFRLRGKTPSRGSPA